MGQALPLLVGLAVIPRLIDGLGTARFGILTLAWSVIGYTSVFDLGLGRALTKLVAERLGKDKEASLGPLIWTGLWLMLVAGAMGALLMSSFTPWLVHSALKVPVDLQPETLIACYEIAVTIPVVIVTTGLRGILEAHQLFGLVNAIRVPLGILTFLGPWICLFISHSLAMVFLSLVAIRLLALVVQLFCVLHYVPSMNHGIRWQGSLAKPLLSFGGWMTVSNLIGPVMVNLDRFLLGAIVSMSAVAYYATPYEMITKLWLVPAAISAVLFPAFSCASEAHDRLHRLLDRGLNYVFILLFPLSLLIITFAHDEMRIWLGESFAQNSTLVLQLLTVGVFLNSLAQISFVFVQGTGRPDLTAKLHISELLVYLPTALWLIHRYGVSGAAIAWVARVLLDTLVLLGINARLLPQSRPAIMSILGKAGLATCLFGLGAVISSGTGRIIFLIFTLALFAWTAWFSILASDERTLVIDRLKVLPLLN